jgi:endoglucanase
MQRVRGGSAAITLSTPTRYVHTVNEMVHKTDVQAGIDLLAASSNAPTRSTPPSNSA